MKRQSRGTAFDISIRGDELEANRIQLEHNLQNTELSFRLSTNSDDDEYDPRPQRRQQQHNNHHYQHHQRQDSSLEYPRHISEPSIPDFPSFAHRSREHFGDEEHSHARGWSYRTGDDEDGISPYGGDTVSTAAHHASALTLSAGLMGGRAARRDPSLSGAEYDPDRPLHAMVAGVNSKHSMFDMTKNTEMAMTYDPLVVDSTAELDRILESGHAPPPTLQSQSTTGRGNVNRPLSPISSASSSTSDSDARHPLSPGSRPKLADHLRHVSFSPKRPRSAAATANPSTSPLGRRRQQSEADPDASMYVNSNAPTPRPSRQPEVRLQPATPSSVGSKFTRMVRGINKELEGAQQQLYRQVTTTNAASSTAVPARKASTPVERNPFHDTPERNTGAGTRRASAMKDNNANMNTTRGKIHLPDVTGLTAAVESPMKAGTQYYKYATDTKQRESEAPLLQTLNAVQGQLHDLEEENGISRRRVRELEMELEECKREVARERTRLFEHEEMSIRYHTQDRNSRGGKANGKGKERDAAPELSDAQLHARYKEAVEEKKSLESLINSLRTHLTRLTSELASHQELLTSLRQLREADAQELRAHSGEILKLREEVQRLAGEVEVLRGVVEEGLKERRASRDISHVEIAEEDRGMSRDLDDDDDEEEDEGHGDTEELERTEEESTHNMMDESDEEPEPFDPVSLEEEQERIQRAADRTMRTDHATLGESTNTNTRDRFVDAEELDDIAAELEERRSNISNGSIRVRSSPEPARRNMKATVDDTQDVEPRHLQQHQNQRQIPVGNRHERAHTYPEPSTSRPSAPTPSHAARRPFPKDIEPATPFPQIRGEHLERLFFSAPEHNAKTCTVCFRRGDHGRAYLGSPSGWSKPRAPAAREREDVQHSDEGYEGSEGERPGNVVDKGKQAQAEALLYGGDAAQWRSAARKYGVPPQTVVARVIRELEDDFTHYKSIYVELADQYKVMDAASDVRRRNTLAKHLREVVDILEQKGDQIASLYDLLSFKDKPVSESVVPEKAGAVSAGHSWGGVASRQQ